MKTKARLFLRILIGLAVLWLCMDMMGGLRNIYMYRQKNQELEQRIVQLEKENEVLKKEKEALETPEKIEEVARQELGLVRPGEVPYVK